MLTSAGRQSGYGAGVGGGQNFDANVYRCAACGVDSSGEVSFIQHIRGKAHAGKAGRYGFAGLLVNDAGVIPPLSFDPGANPMGPGGGGDASVMSKVNFTGGKKNKAEVQIFRCRSCLVDSAGILSYLEHINGKAHIRKAGRIGFSGLVPNDAGVVPRLPEDPRDPFADQRGQAEADESSVSMGISRDKEQLLRAALMSHSFDRQNKGLEGEGDGAGAAEPDDDDDDVCTKDLPASGGNMATPAEEKMLGGRPMAQAFGGGGRPPPRAGSDRFAPMRMKLPVFEWKGALLDALDKNQVVVIQGETGCGKTTQVPHYVLEAAAEAGRPCNVVCTQPRRISAIGVATRVAEERGETCGRTVGYSIRHESMASRDTMLLFCTTGTLLRRLEGDPTLRSVSHVFVDEVHERGLESDFLLLALKDLMPKRPDVKIVLMSATMDTERFSAYFGGAPIFKVPGRTYPVKTLYLEDAFKLTGHRIDPRAEWSKTGGGWRKNKSSSSLSTLPRSKSPEFGECGGEGKEDTRPVSAGRQCMSYTHTHEHTHVCHTHIRTHTHTHLQVSEKADWELEERELAMRYGRNYGALTIRNMMIMDPGQVNYQLVADLICSDVLYQMRGGNFGPNGGGGGNLGKQARYAGGQPGQGQQWPGQRGPGMSGYGHENAVQQQEQQVTPPPHTNRNNTQTQVVIILTLS